MWHRVNAALASTLGETSCQGEGAAYRLTFHSRDLDEEWSSEECRFDDNCAGWCRGSVTSSVRVRPPVERAGGHQVHQCRTDTSRRHSSLLKPPAADSRRRRSWRPPYDRCCIARLRLLTWKLRVIFSPAKGDRFSRNLSAVAFSSLVATFSPHAVCPSSASASDSLTSIHAVARHVEPERARFPWKRNTPL